MKKEQKETKTYLLRGIPAALWRKVGIKCKIGDITIKDLLLQKLKEYAASKKK